MMFNSKIIDHVAAKGIIMPEGSGGNEELIGAYEKTLSTYENAFEVEAS